MYDEASLHPDPVSPGALSRALTNPAYTRILPSDPSFPWTRASSQLIPAKSFPLARASPISIAKPFISRRRARYFQHTHIHSLFRRRLCLTRRIVLYIHFVPPPPPSSFSGPDAPVWNSPALSRDGRERETRKTKQDWSPTHMRQLLLTDTDAITPVTTGRSGLVATGASTGWGGKSRTIMKAN